MDANTDNDPAETIASGLPGWDSQSIFSSSYLSTVLTKIRRINAF
jgi:hypothetical protein